MEFWEGAVIVVGGLWLIGRMSRQSAAHPLNAMPNPTQTTGQFQTYNSSRAGTTIIAGENIGISAPALPSAPVNPAAMVVSRPSAPIRAYVPTPNVSGMPYAYTAGAVPMGAMGRAPFNTWRPL